MSVESHLAELERRHEALDREIEAAQARPGIDDVEIVALKKRKMQLKDEITSFRNKQTVH